MTDNAYENVGKLFYFLISFGALFLVLYLLKVGTLSAINYFRGKCSGYMTERMTDKTNSRGLIRYM